MTYKQSNECPVCRQAMGALIDLPRYPLTEMYEPYDAGAFEDRGYVDQSFLYCEGCGHGKLGTIVPPSMLYGEGYRTKTGASQGAVRAVRNFAGFIAQNCDLSIIQTFIDIGGNDGCLLGNIDCMRTPPYATINGVQIDPNASGPFTNIRAFIESADLGPWHSDAKLIVSSHTLEHVENVSAFLEKVADGFNYDCTLAIQVPSLELLVADARMEQIHHQHIHYFSMRSLSGLLWMHGFEIYAHRFDSDHYGALMVLARKGRGERLGERIESARISEAKNQFVLSTMTCNNMLKGRSFVALGAALMLPVFAHYLPELRQCEYVADNDRSKDGLRYINFNRPIRCDYDLAGRDVVITALNTKLAGRALMQLAFEKGARNVYLPLHNV